MTGGDPLDRIEIVLRNRANDHRHTIYIDVFDNSLSQKWLAALDDILDRALHLEKNYCFMGLPDSDRPGVFLLEQINLSIKAINDANIGYVIDDCFEMDDVITDDQQQGRACGRNLRHDRFNQLHRYFEDLQGVSGRPSKYYLAADPSTRWHIRQLNLLCHEFESWALSWRKQIEAPEWQRPSQLMCWLNAPRFVLDQRDYELFGIDTINRDLGGVFVGVNKAVGKHHWEVFNDEGRDSRIGELTTSVLKSQTEAAGDFDIEWGRNPAGFEWQQRKLNEFRGWLQDNGFDPNDPSLTIGHPQVGQVDLDASFGTQDPSKIWECLRHHADVITISTSQAKANYDYHWSDPDFQQRQIKALAGE